MNIIVFAPHPDDELIGCGGSIAKHVAAGHNVHVVYLTSGDAGSLKISKKALSVTREKEAVAGLRILGIQSHQFLRLPDGYVTESDETLNTLVALIRTKKPDCIYIPHARDAHRDHKRTYTLVAEALKRADDHAFQECNGNPWYTKTVFITLEMIRLVQVFQRFSRLKICSR